MILTPYRPMTPQKMMKKGKISSRCLKGIRKYSNYTDPTNTGEAVKVSDGEDMLRLLSLFHSAAPIGTDGMMSEAVERHSTLYELSQTCY